MHIEEAYSTLAKASPDFARFYAPGSELPLGSGLIFRRLALPFYNKSASEFSVALSLAYVVSHECDIDPANHRPFNDLAVVVPIIPLGTLLTTYLSKRTDEQARAFVDALAKRTIDRAAYIPTIADELPHGGVLYLNSMSHTHVSEFAKAGVDRCCTVTAFGLQYMDAALSHALIKRPKAVALPLTGDLDRWRSREGPTIRNALVDLYTAVKSRRL